MEIRNFQELVSAVQGGKRKGVAVTAAADGDTVVSAIRGAKENIAEPIFIGDGREIEKILASLGEPRDLYEIVNEPDAGRTPAAACRLVGEGRASIVMKGFLDTSVFLGGILDKECGLRAEGPMSHVAVMQIPGYHKVLAVTDAGMIPAPDLEQKTRIVRNAVGMMAGLGYARPNVAAVTASEKASRALPETLDAEALREAAERGEIAGCTLEGPVSYDIVMSRESALRKGYGGQNSGNYDILLVPGISAGNILCKALIYNASAKMAGIVAGAKAPLVVNSRSSPPEEKFYALVLAAASQNVV